MTKMRKARLGAAAMAAVAAAGCSTNQFKDPVQSFDASVGATQELVRQYDVVMQQAGSSADILSLRQSPDRLSFDAAECNIGSPQKCYVRNDSSDHDLGADGPDTAAADAAKLLRVYSHNLAAVVEADTEDDLDKGADKLGVSVAALAKKTGAAAGLQADINPVTALFKFLAGNYLEYKRFKILRSAVDQANAPVKGLSRLLADKLQAKQLGAMQLQAAGTEDLVATLPPGRKPPRECLDSSSRDRHGARTERSEACAIYDERELARLYGLTTAMQSAAALRAMAATDARAAVLQLGEAHQALADAVDRPGAGIDASTKALESFGKQVKDAYEAVNKLSK